VTVTETATTRARATFQLPPAPKSARRNGGRLKAKTGYVLDIGCGPNKQPGAVGMDVRPGPGIDIVHDWNRFPWPLDDESALTVIASNVVEHVNPADGHFVAWMNEVWRILKPGRQMAIVTPYGGSPMYWSDPTHCNGCNQVTWWYFDPEIKVAYAGGNGTLYQIYEPKPWKIESMFFKQAGMMEVVMSKRADDASYHQQS
jgi:SAM-dependent methyltransferase